MTLLLSSFQGVFLHVPGTRVPRAGTQGGYDKRWRPHSTGTKPLLHLPASLLCPALLVTLPRVELPQVRIAQTAQAFRV